MSISTDPTSSIALIGLFLVVWYLVVQHYETVFIEAVVPISGYQQNTLFNGNPTTRNTVIITCTESDAFGTLLVGNYTLNVTCVPPSYNYRYTAVGSVPRATQLHIEKSCLIKDGDQYAQSRNLAAAQSTNANTQTDTQSLTSPASRRLLTYSRDKSPRRELLFLEFAAVGLSIYAVVKAEQANAKADYAIQKITSLGDDVRQLGDQTVQLTKNTDLALSATAAQGEAIKGLTNQTESLFNDTRTLQKSFSSLSTQVISLANQTQAQFKAVGDALLKNTKELALSQEVQFNHTNQQFQDVYTQMIAMNTQLEQEVTGLLRGQMEQAESIQNTLVVLSTLIRQAQLHRLTIASYFTSLDELDQRLKPFTLGLGVRPTQQLFGPDKRVLIDRLDLNWVGITTGASYTIYASQLRFYVDTLWGVDYMRYTTTLEAMTTLFGERTCARAYGDPDTPLDSGSVSCRVWAELRVSTCVSGQLSPKFSWRQVNSTSLKQSYCTDQIQTQPVQIFRNFQDLVTAFGQDPCTTPALEQHVVSYRTQNLFILPKNSLCTMTWRDQLYLSKTNGTASGYSLMYSMTALAANSLKLVFLDLYDKELQLYGRNPGGFKYEKRDNDYVPTTYNGTTPVYDGGAEPLDCSYATWLAVHRQAINMYSVTPLSSPIVRKSVLVGVSGPQCLDPTVCYPVGERDVLSNIQLNNDASATLPGDFLMLGELKDMRQGIWDVPSRSLSASSATSERANTPSYILMPPDTTDTYELPDWIGRNTDLFDPALAAVSPELYRYDTAFDRDNYPYCDLHADELVRWPNQTTNGCITPYRFNATTLLNPWQTPVQFPAACGSVTFQSVYTVYSNELQTATIVTTVGSATANAVASGSPHTLTFWYKQDPVLGDGGQVSLFGVFSNVLSSFVRYGVNSAGRPFVNHKNAISTLATGVDLRDGVWHYVAWSVSVSGAQFHYKLTIDRTYYGDFAPAGASFVSSSPFVQRLNLMSPQSVSAELSLVQIQLGTALSSTVLAALQACGFSTLPIDRCVQTGTEVVLARQDIVRSGGVSCLGSSQLLLADFRFDALFPITRLLTSAMAGSFSVSFWVRGGDSSVPNVKLVELAANKARLVVQYTSATLVSLQLNGQATTVQAYDGRSHFIVLTFDTAVANVYMDGNFVVTFAAASNSTFSTPIVDFPSDTIFQFKYYNQTVLGTDQVYNEGVCQFGNVMNATSLVSPVGSCYMNTGQSTGFGYCRHFGSCAGHCTSYSYINRATGVYSVVDNGCDTGYSRPECTSRCSRIDAVSGQCLTEQTTKATGLSPGSTLCSTLNNYKLSVNPSSGLMTLTPRVWQYTVSVGVPNGLITNVINTGSCPKTSIFPAIDGSYNVVMENQNTASSVVSVLYAPETVFLQGAACESPCCQLSTDVTYSIAGSSGFTVNVPSAGCGNLTIIVQMAVNVFDPFSNSSATTGGECSRFDAGQLLAIVSTAFNQPVSTNIASRITVSLNTASEAVKDVVSALGNQLVDLIMLGASIGFNSDTFGAILQQQRTLLSQERFNPLNLTTSLPEFNVTALIDQVAAGAVDLDAAFNKSGVAFQEQSLRIRALSASADDLINQTRAGIEKSRAMSAEFDRLYNAFLGIECDNCDVGSFGAFLEKLGAIVGDTVLNAAHAGSSFLDSALDLIGLPGSLLGGLGNFLGDIFKFVIYGIIVYGAYIVGKGLWSLKGNSRSSSKADSSSKYKVFRDEEQPVHHEQSGLHEPEFDTHAEPVTPIPELPPEPTMRQAVVSSWYRATRAMQRNARYNTPED